MDDAEKLRRGRRDGVVGLHTTGGVWTAVALRCRAYTPPPCSSSCSYALFSSCAPHGLSSSIGGTDGVPFFLKRRRRSHRRANFPRSILTSRLIYKRNRNRGRICRQRQHSSQLSPNRTPCSGLSTHMRFVCDAGLTNMTSIFSREPS